MATHSWVNASATAPTTVALGAAATVPALGAHDRRVALRCGCLSQCARIGHRTCRQPDVCCRTRTGEQFESTVPADLPQPLPHSTHSLPSDSDPTIPRSSDGRYTVHQGCVSAPLPSTKKTASCSHAPQQSRWMQDRYDARHFSMSIRKCTSGQRFQCAQKIRWSACSPSCVA